MKGLFFHFLFKLLSDNWLYSNHIFDRFDIEMDHAFNINTFVNTLVNRNEYKDKHDTTYTPC